MKKRLISFVLATLMVISLFQFPSIADGDTSVVLQSSTKGLVLSTGDYSVKTNTEISNSTVGGSGITITPGSTVNIYIAEGVTLTVTGADGSYTIGGGAGIYIPAGATLYVYGGGTLIARGGNAGNGSNGSDGGQESTRFLEYVKASVQKLFGGSYSLQSAGGEGGAGGGGAGAGIGTPGATGSYGGLGGFSAAYILTDDDGKKYVEVCEDVDGKSGDDAVAPESMGTFLSDNVKISAFGGNSGSAGNGGKIGTKTVKMLIRSWTYELIGAGGGGGGGGYSGAAIGTGGYSGAGGGGGGSSPYSEDDDADQYTDIGGYGGSGANKGFDGVSYTGGGDEGGYGGSSGTKGKIGISKEFKISYNTNGGNKISNKKYTFGKSTTLPTPTKDNYEFVGWYKDSEFLGEAVTSVTADDAGDKTFYAKWEEIVIKVDPSVSVNNKDIIVNYNDYQVDNVKLAYIGPTASEISDWTSFASAGNNYKSINGQDGFIQHLNPTDGESYSQSVTGYYAAYIHYLDGEVEHEAYSVVYVDTTADNLIPEIVEKDDNIVLNSNGYYVEKLILAYVGKEEIEINDLNALTTEGNKYKYINGNDGFIQYSTPIDGFAISNMPSGYYASCICYYEGDSEAPVEVYKVLGYKIADLKTDPSVTAEDGKFVIHNNDYVITKVSYAYIGNEYVEVNDWAALVKNGLLYTNINGTSGNKQDSAPYDGKEYKQSTIGYYAVFLRYYEGETKIETYTVIQIENTEPLVAPSVTVEDGKLVVHDNDYKITKVSYAYIGTEFVEVKDWAALVNNGLKYTNINGGSGCYMDSSPYDGKEYKQSNYGYYAVFLRYFDGDNKIEAYTVVQLEKTGPLVTPSVSTDDNKLIVHDNDYKITKVSYAYIGDTFVEVKDWAALVNNGLKYTNINGGSGCYMDSSPYDGKEYKQSNYGYYAVFLRYFDGDNKIETYTVVKLEKTGELSAPTVSTDDNKFIVHDNDYKITKVSYAYIGEAFVEVKDWAALVNNGLKYTDVNGGSGNIQDSSPYDGKEYKQINYGYYAVFLRYFEGEKKIETYTVIQLEKSAEKIAPSITSEDGKFIVHDNDYKITKVSYAFIGDSFVEVKDWAALVNNGLKFTDVNGNSGNIQDSSPYNGKEYKQSSYGYYAVFLRYFEGEKKIETYTVINVDTAKVAPSFEVCGNSIVLHENGYPINKFTYAYIGVEDKEITRWAELTKAADVYPHYNGYGSYFQNSKPKDNASYQMAVTGYYATYLRYYINEEMIEVYDVVFVDASTGKNPNFTYDKSNIYLHTEGLLVAKISAAYIGMEYKEITNWAQFEAAGKMYTEINGSIGCNHYKNVVEGFKVPFNVGIVAFYVKYYDAAGTIHEIYKLVSTGNEVPPTVVGGNQMFSLITNGKTVLKISYAYIGDEQISIQNWSDLVTAGSKYPEINPKSTSCVHDSSPWDDKIWISKQQGFYAIYIRYLEDGQTIERYLTCEVI